MMFVVDTAEGRIVDDAELKRDVAGRFPYRKWLDEERVRARRARRRQAPPAITGDRADAAAARVRLHRRGPRPDHRRRWPTTGKEPIGSMGTDTPLAVLSRSRAEPVRLLPPAVRPGDEPADRSDPRGARDVARDDARSRRQHVRRDARAVPPARAARPDPRQRRAREDPRDARRRVRADHAVDGVAGQSTARAGSTQALDKLCARRRAGDRRRPQRPDPQRPRRRRQARRDPVAARAVRGAAAPRARGHSHAGRSRRRDRARCARSTTSRCSSATAPPR